MQQKLKEYLIEEKMDEKSKRTLEHYEHVINIFIDYLNGQEVTKAKVMEFKDSLQEKYADSTVNNYLVITNKFIKYLEIVEKDDFEFYKLKDHKSKKAVKNIKIQQKASLDDLLEPVELKRMLRYSKKYDYQMYLIIRILSYTGIRAQELHYFTVENIETTNTIRIKNKGKVREIPIIQSLRKELKDYAKSKGIESGFIFTGKAKGKMLHYTTIYKSLKRIAGKCRGIKIDKVHPHSFRHLFAVQFLETGGDLTELADILGHSSVDTTRIYTRTTAKMKRKRLEEKFRY